MAYATTTELQNHLDPDPLPTNASLLLDRASRDVDAALKTSVYDVDDDGNPTDTKVIAALRDATLEQVSWRLSQGDTNGLGTPYQTVTIGSVSLGRAGGTSAPGASGVSLQLGGQARQILDDAQLLNFEPWTW